MAYEFKLSRSQSDRVLVANWLPAPDGPFYMLMRYYWPEEDILDGTWKQPAVEKSK